MSRLEVTDCRTSVLACPTHGGRSCLANAGAPNLVRCTASGMVFEPCRRCRGRHVHFEGGTATFCPACTITPHPGWAVFPHKANGVYPVS